MGMESNAALSPGLELVFAQRLAGQGQAIAQGSCTGIAGTIAIATLHLHHVLFYRPLPMVDWVHHIVMIFIVVPLGYGLQPGTVLHVVLCQASRI